MVLFYAIVRSCVLLILMTSYIQAMETVHIKTGESTPRMSTVEPCNNGQVVSASTGLASNLSNGT